MPSRSSTPPARILVVDDEALIRDTLAEYLQQEGFVVDTTGSGEAALPKRLPQAIFTTACRTTS